MSAKILHFFLHKKNTHRHIHTSINLWKDWRHLKSATHSECNSKRIPEPLCALSRRQRRATAHKRNEYFRIAFYWKKKKINKKKEFLYSRSSFLLMRDTKSTVAKQYMTQNTLEHAMYFVFLQEKKNQKNFFREFI